MSEIPMAPDPQDPRVAPQPEPAPSTTRSRLRRNAPAVGLLVAGLVVGALGVGVLGHTASGPTGNSSAAAATRQGGPRGGFPGGPGGGIAGEMRVTGTITAVGSSSVTVEQADGTTATYSANATTDVRRDGVQSSLSALKVGDQVLVHAVPSTSGSGKVAERILVGTPGTQDGPGGGLNPATGA
jgi:hypothetical protein